MTIRRNKSGQIHKNADVFAMHRRQMRRLGSRPSRSHVCGDTGGATESGRKCEKATPPGERCRWHRESVHECDRGGRLNGWPICWRCYVDAVLWERLEREASDLVDMDDVLNGRHG